jgi:hypothetical protein
MHARPRAHRVEVQHREGVLLVRMLRPGLGDQGEAAATHTGREHTPSSAGAHTHTLPTRATGCVGREGPDMHPASAITGKADRGPPRPSPARCGTLGHTCGPIRGSSCHRTSVRGL